MTSLLSEGDQIVTMMPAYQAEGVESGVRDGERQAHDTSFEDWSRNRVFGVPCVLFAFPPFPGIRAHC